MGEGGWTKDLLILLATAGVVVPLFGRLRFGTVIGFLLAGVILGPGGLGRLAVEMPWLAAITFSDPEEVRPFAELGVLFLLFLIGLGLSVDRLWAMRRIVLGVGSAQFFVSAVLILCVGLLFGLDFRATLVAGLALALSSTAIVTQLMIEARRFATPIGRLAVGVLLFQDLMVVPIVIVVGLLGGNEVAIPWALARALLLAVAAIAAILVVGRFVVRPLLRLAAATGSRELVVGIALFLAVGTALLTERAGLSAALGAFLAGLLLGESEYRHQLEVDIEPFKGLLLGLFFMTVGMSFDPSRLGGEVLVIGAAVVALLVAKGCVMYAAAVLFRVERPIAVESAFLLAGPGEFAFVVFTLARRAGVVESETYQGVVSAAALAMLAIPGLAVLGRRIGARMIARRAADRHGAANAESALGEAFSDHIVIGGFGRVGRTIARVLDSEGIPYVAVDLNPERVTAARREGRPVFYGDATRQEILEKIGGGKARGFVITTDRPEATQRMARAIAAAWPAVPVYARARDADHLRELAAIGVANVVPEALEGSLQLAGRVLQSFGLPEEAIEARLGTARSAEIRLLGKDDG